MTVEQLSGVILGLVGVLVQLIFMYVPKLKDWYQAQQNKGLIMLAVVVVVGAIYFGLACSPYAVELGIALTCNVNGVFLLLKALFTIAATQQLAYLYTRNNKALKTRK